jgi:hypothetical protein
MTPDQYNAQIMAALLQIQRDVAEIKNRVTGGGGATAGRSSGAPTQQDGAIASDRDLDGDHGDPTIKYDPSARYWNGESFAGYRFSETTPEYLDAMAKYLDACAYMAEKDPDEKKRKGATYKRKDAARARGWAIRLRNGWAVNGGGAQPPPPPGGGYDQHAEQYSGGEDGLPF